MNWKGDRGYIRNDQFTLKASSKKGFELGIQIGEAERDEGCLNYWDFFLYMC